MKIDEEDKTAAIEKSLKTVESIMFRYKLFTTLFGIITGVIFIVYYYNKASIISYVISMGLLVWVLYTAFMRMSELRLLKVEVKILIEEYKRRRQKELQKK